MADTTGSPESLLDPINAIVLPIFAFLAILITILPGRDFYRVHNFPAFNIILVNNLLNIQYMVNAIIWRTEDFSKWFKGYGLCDFEVLLRTPLTVCLAFSLLRYIRHIANALTSKGAQEQFGETNAEKKRKWFIDILWCYTVPLFQTTLQHLVLNDRYSIIVTVGCLTNLDNSWLNIALVGVWFPILMISTLYYACKCSKVTQSESSELTEFSSVMLAFRIFKHRRNIMGALRNSGSTLSDRQYMKLVILVFLLAFCYIPISCIFFKNSFPKGGITSYSWGRNHAPGWGDIYFDTLWHAGKLFQYIGWASIAWNILMFFFFGLNDAAIDTYRLLLVKLGMGKIWPSLRRPGQSHRRGTSTIHKIASWLLNKLDVIGWVLRKVENSTLLNALENTKFMQKVLECHKSRKGKPSVWKFWLWFNRNGSQNSQTTTTTTAQTMTTGDENERGLTTSGGIPLQDL
jgi:pheromone a factor receptor